MVQASWHAWEPGRLERLEGPHLALRMLAGTRRLCAQRHNFCDSRAPPAARRSAEGWSHPPPDPTIANTSRFIAWQQVFTVTLPALQADGN